jgi:hypothetical protein
MRSRWSAAVTPIALHDAFRRYLRRGGAGYYRIERFAPEEVIALILGADAFRVGAPHARTPELHKLAAKLRFVRVMGWRHIIRRQRSDSDVLVSIARQNN